MPRDNTQQTDVKTNRSIDTLLDDLKRSPSTTNKSGSNDESSNIASNSRRKNIDRRDFNPALKRGTDERRTQVNRRTKKAVSQKAKPDLAVVRNEMKLQQHRKKILLAGCEPIMGFNFDSLALDDYPDNALVSAARRDRDYWVFICAIFTTVFFFGLIGVVSPWVAGSGAGLAFLSAIFSFTPFRTNFFTRPHLHELLKLRKKLEFTALSHIQYLEGKDGLAWRCSKLKKYNSNMGRKLFSGLFYFSKERELLSVLKNKKHIRLYLLLMIESQKAYKRLEKDYLENHFKNLDSGWDDRIDSVEASKLEQTLNLDERSEEPAPGS